MKNIKNLYYPFLLVFISLFFNVANAQKLPKTQEVSIRAPKEVKVDGKQTEWGSKLQAYNNSAQVFYTIANDDDKLYLVVQVTDQLVIRKIIAGGITLTITSDKEADHNKPIEITYPLYSQQNWPVINLNKKPLPSKDGATIATQLDSFIRAANKQLTDRSKEIKLLGAKGLQDTLVSVYNDEGIKAAGLLNNQLVYTYELAIPLKYLNLSFKGQQQLRYNIKLNGSSFVEGNIIEDIEGGTRVRSLGNSKDVPMTDMKFIRFPTNFSGNYTLVKK